MLTWTVEEIERFEAFVRGTREFALYYVALATWMRRGELLGLRRRDVDRSAGRLKVRQRWTTDGDRGRRFITLKTGTRAWRRITVGSNAFGSEQDRSHGRSREDAQDTENPVPGDQVRADLEQVRIEADDDGRDVPLVSTRRWPR